MKKASYRKVGPRGCPELFRRITAVKDAGQFICDAIAHNSPSGCPNPKCFNYVARKK